MSLTDFFKSLGAPLANSRWSWGGVRPDGTVVLRVWQDEHERHEGQRCMRVTYHSRFEEVRASQGYPERMRHLELVRSGATCYLVMCKANPALLPRREVMDFDQADVFLAGSPIDVEGDTWLPLKARVAAHSLGA